MSGQQKKNARKAKKQKDRQARISQQSHARKSEGKKTPAQEVHLALALINQGNVSGGSQVLERLRKKHPGEPLVSYGLGVLALKKGEFKASVHWFEQAVEMAPDHIEAHYNLAVAYQKTNDIPGMIMAYKHVIENGEPDSYPVNKSAENLARIEQSLKERDGIGLTEFIEGHHYFNQGLEKMAQKAWNEAVEYFHQAVRIHPGNVQSHGNLGICYAMQGKKTDARAAFDMALELNPDYEPARIHRDRLESLGNGERFTED